MRMITHHRIMEYLYMFIKVEAKANGLEYDVVVDAVSGKSIKSEN